MKWIKENAKPLLGSLLIISSGIYSSNALAVETINPGNINSILYAADGVNFKLKKQDGSSVTDSGVCGSNDTFHLSSSHANYKAALGAVVSAHASRSFLTLTLDGCNGSNSLITSLEIGTSPDAGTPIVAGLMSSLIVTGNGAYQEVLSNIDTVNNEAMIVAKNLSSVSDWAIFDTTRGPTFKTSFNSDTAQATVADGLTNFRVDGHAVGGNSLTNGSSESYLHWTMKSKDGFFDVVKYSGTGSSQTISHNINGQVGMIWIKNISASGDWMLWHNSFATGEYVKLNTNEASAVDTNIFSSSPTNTSFSVGNSSNVNASGNTYVAYIFAHNPSNQIYIGNYNGTGGSGNKQTIGFKPKFIMLKNKGTGSYHFFTDVQQSSDAWQNYVIPNDTLQQVSISTSISVVNDGFSFTGGSGNWSGSNIIYIAVGDPQ